MTISALQLERAKEANLPKLPKSLKGAVKIEEGKPTESAGDREEIRKLFPNTYGAPVVTFVESKDNQSFPPINVGVILSGGQAPGGHNVIAGLFKGLKTANTASKLYGFKMGPGGLLKGNNVLLEEATINQYINTGGFDIIGSDRTKLQEKAGHFERAKEVLNKLEISALVIIGGDDSNTNACVLAEYFKKNKLGIQVIGCPKTIDGDLKNEQIETSFGFDTACKVYSEVIGNIQRDCNSAKKYWHFIKLMGRSASHIALECALQTHPNYCIISEEVEKKNLTLDDIITTLKDLIIERNTLKEGDKDTPKNFGTVLIPEGLIEFIPAIKKLIEELNVVLAQNDAEFKKFVKKREQVSYIISKLSEENAKVYESLPESVARQLALDRDSHGNVQVSLIETEKLLADMVKAALKAEEEPLLQPLLEEKAKLDAKIKLYAEDKAKLQPLLEEKAELDAKIKPIKNKYNFSPQTHFFGYEGRCAAPSIYDANYCYALGYNASKLILAGKTGYMSSVRNTTAPVDEWIAGGIPITMMMNMENKPIKDKDGKLSVERVPVIQKALVKLDDAPFREFASKRKGWETEDDYVYPGPIQFWGPPEVCERPTITLQLEQKKH
ncbi:MAG: diphosphate--fructose-6-phosphate 1-phosphotransferase [Tannerella sp.]|jgi:pyrophosphate--fructose-6-phosphate 1-phosphotransferase|nr:diphosphate--fructose-6-phosphate 1-phosphotransferase [Tannerella sp.]